MEPYILDKENFGGNVYFSNEKFWLSYLRKDATNLFGFSVNTEINKFVLQGEVVSAVSAGKTNYGAYALLLYRATKRLGFSVKPEFYSENNNPKYYFSAGLTAFVAEGNLLRFWYEINSGPVIQVLTIF